MVSADCTVRWTGKCHCGGCVSGMQPVMSIVRDASLHRLAMNSDKKSGYDYSKTTSTSILQMMSSQHSGLLFHAD